MNCPRPAKISFRDEFSKGKDCPMNFPRLGKIIRSVSGNRQQLQAAGFCMRRKLPLLANELSQAGKNHSVSVWQEPWL